MLKILSSLQVSWARPAITVWLKLLWLLICGARGPHEGYTSEGLWLGDQESACQCRRHGFHPLVGRIPWSRKWQSTPIFLLVKFHGQRSLAGYIQSMGPRRVRHD